jgi:hypothetical protein
MKKAKVDANIVREFLLYDPHTGEFTWKERSLPWFKREQDWKRWNKQFANKPAGCINTAGHGRCHLFIRIFGRPYTGAQLAYLYMMGEWATGYLTPVNGNSLDIRIENLLENIRGKGKSLYTNNRSGVTGVHWNKLNRRWKAQARFNGEFHYLGCFKNIDEAEAVVEKFYKEHGFLPRHGQPTPVAA